jgi:hypothetical protein
MALISLANMNLTYSHRQGSASVVEPVAIFDARKDISDIQWSNIDEDVVFISFSYSPEVLVVNLNDTSIQKTLLVGKEVTSGHKSLLLLPSSANGSTVEQVIVGGSSSGVIRAWSNYKVNKNRAAWEIVSDPTYSAGKSAQVVSIVPLGQIKGGFISSNSAGIITIWDCEHLTTAAFGSSGTPTCLLRLSLVDALTQILPSSRVDNKLLGLETNPSGELIASFSTGHVCSFDLSKGELSHLTTLNLHSSLVSTDPVRQIDDFGQTIQLAQNSMLFPAAHLRILKQSFLLLQDLQNRDLAIISTSRRRSSDSTSLTWRRCLDYNFTMPGQIINCEHGSKYLETSIDLSEYLLPTAVAPHCTSKSHQIKLDWRRVDVQHALTSLNTEVHKPDIYSISSIFGRVITLDSPYLGPTVQAGRPYVHLRTNLQVCRAAADPILSRSSSRASSEYKILSSESSTTRICSHPSLEYAVVGFRDDSIKILHIGNE